jgi:hypothetical protein
MSCCGYQVEPKGSILVETAGFSTILSCLVLDSWTSLFTDGISGLIQVSQKLECHWHQPPEITNACSSLLCDIQTSHSWHHRCTHFVLSNASAFYVSILLLSIKAGTNYVLSMPVPYLPCISPYGRFATHSHLSSEHDCSLKWSQLVATDPVVPFLQLFCRFVEILWNDVGDAFNLECNL